MAVVTWRDIRPTWGVDVLPVCSRHACPRYRDGRCMDMLPGSDVCEPATTRLMARLQAAGEPLRALHMCMIAAAIQEAE